MQRIDFEHEISQSGYAGCLILRKAKQLAAYPGVQPIGRGRHPAGTVDAVVLLHVEVRRGEGRLAGVCDGNRRT